MAKALQIVEIPKQLLISVVIHFVVHLRCRLVALLIKRICTHWIQSQLDVLRASKRPFPPHAVV